MQIASHLCMCDLYTHADITTLVQSYRTILYQFCVSTSPQRSDLYSLLS